MAELVKFDSSSRLRLIDPEVHGSSETLERQSREFVANLATFTRNVLEHKGGIIEKEKLRAIGHRNRVEGQSEERKRLQRELELQIADKQAKLDRLATELETLQRVEQDQRLLIDKLSRNEM
eukprot:m51a1_g2297 putative intraflagellar transport (122) ;mRNA; r:422761-423191